MRRGKNRLPIASWQLLTRNYRRPNGLVKWTPNSLPSTRKGFNSSSQMTPAVR